MFCEEITVSEGTRVQAVVWLLRKGEKVKFICTLSVPDSSEAVSVATCPNCGKDVAKPKKTIDNRMFHLEYYVCDKCGKAFTISS